MPCSSPPVSLARCGQLSDSDGAAAAASARQLQQRLFSLALGAALMLGLIFAIKMSFDVTQPRSGIDAPSVGATAE